MSLPRIVVLGTGGTIAGTRAVGVSYRSAVMPVTDLVGGLELSKVADLRVEQVFQTDSVDLGLTHMMTLARIISERLADRSVDAVVVTHGTDTLEESAFLVNLVVRSPKPIVFLGSMRPADALSADGPDNLFDAISVAAHPSARGLGVLVIMDDRIHAARDVMKTNTTRTDAFRSPYGPLGEVIDGKPHLFRAPARRHTTTSAFDVAEITALPRVETLTTHAEIPLELLDAYAAAGIDGLIHIGAGNGNISRAVLGKLDELISRGVSVVRASRVGSGIVTRNGAGNDDDHGLIAADDHNPAHARILLSLALTKTRDPQEIQELFWSH